MKKLVFFLSLGISAAAFSQQNDSSTVDACFKKADFRCAEAGYQALATKETNGKLKAGFYNNLGISQRRLGKTSLAFKSFENAIKANPQDLSAYINLSSLHQQKGDKAKALEYVRLGLMIDDSNADLKITRAKVYEDQKKNDLADAEYKNLVASSPDNLIARTNYAVFKKNNGKLEEAMKYYNQLISKKPESLLYNNRADVFLAMNKYKEATADIEKAIKLDPKFSQSYVTKSKIQFATGKDKDACTTLEKAVATGYEKYLIGELLKKCGK